VSLSGAEQAQFAADVEREGWAVTPPVVPQLVVDQLITELEMVADANGPRGGVRNLFDASPRVRALATSPAVRSVAEAVLSDQCFAVRAILFDKTPTANWKVVWHQDVAIAVQGRANVAGFGPWSEKGGVPHVQPPADLLDDCTADNGPVRVLPRSHRVGRLSAAAIDHWRSGNASVDCLADRGAILAFRPLLLHASSPAASPAHRRVVHLEFAADELPAPLEWHTQVA
jgi:ectoine hydroxylase-related dioxygenase (phytanoyl-CoA dioxygenase family)